MSTQLAVVPEDPFNDRRLALIREKFANNAPPDEFDVFIEFCRSRNLDPLQKQAYLIPRQGKWTIQTSIDGYRAIADRTGAYAGSDDAAFTERDGKPATATVTVWKIVQGVRCPFTATARWTEYYQDKSPLWGKMPHTMLAKCAESLALRKAFPAQLGGLYTDTEMDQADRPDVIEAETVTVAGRVVERETGEIVATNEPEPEDDDHPPAPITAERMRGLHGAGADRGLEHPDLSNLAQARFGVASMADLTQDEASVLLAWVEQYDRAGWATVNAYAATLGTAASLDVLDRTAREMKGAGVHDLNLIAIYRARRKKVLRQLAEAAAPANAAMARVAAATWR